MTETIVIDSHYCGPATSGNGGYVAGVVARFIDGPALVSLRLPPPLDTNMTVQQSERGVTLMHDDRIIAEGQSHPAVDIDVPAMPTSAQAEAAATRYLHIVPEHHVFPNCFVCGPHRAEGQGLRIFSGGVEGRDIVAAPWTPAQDLAREDGTVKDEILWAALDCPGFFAIWERDGSPTVAVLGQLTVDLKQPVRAGERHTVIGWPIDRDGRKHSVGTAIYTADGDVAGVGLGLWIDVPEEVWSDLLKNK